MKKEILVSVYKEENEDDFSKLATLIKRYQTLEFIMYKCNFAGHGEVGDSLDVLYEETIFMLRKLISKNAVEFYELDENGKRIEFDLNEEE